MKLGASLFWSIIFSNPLPRVTQINIWGTMPIKVAIKKFIDFTLKIHGKTFDIANGIPPTNL